MFVILQQFTNKINLQFKPLKMHKSLRNTLIFLDKVTTQVSYQLSKFI